MMLGGSRSVAQRGLPKSAGPSIDAIAVPGLLLLVAADLLIRDPCRALAWRLLHGLGPEGTPKWLAPLVPVQATFDRDPLALFLAAIAVALAIGYLGAAIRGASIRARSWIIAGGVLALVVFPTFLYVAVGSVTGRPFGQDGGVVQLPLAMDRLLSGTSPYGADYSDSILGKESRASEFWRAYGQNPILHHHAYLPGTHLLNLPFYLGGRAIPGGFDARLLTALALLAAMLSVLRLFKDRTKQLVAVAILGLNPLIYWHTAFGANDLVFVALLLLSAVAGESRRLTLAGALLGLACATKQLAWPFAPFLLLHWSGAGSFGELGRRETWARLRSCIFSAAAVFASVVVPVLLLNPAAFWNDIFSYNAGMSADAYPLGGTPGFGVGNLILYFGRVHSLRDAFPFYRFYFMISVLGILLVRAQFRRGGLGVALGAGSVSLLAAVYFSRVAHANYLIAIAVFLPLSVLLDDLPADIALTPLALLAWATTVAGSGFFRSAWQSAQAALSLKSSPILALLAPRGSDALTTDPLGLGLSAVAAGLALTYAAAAILGASARVRGSLVLLAIVVVVGIPSLVVAGIGSRAGFVLAGDDWAVQIPAEAARLASGESPYSSPPVQGAEGKEAWSTSFSLKPARLLEQRPEMVLPGAPLLDLALAPFGLVDARALLLFSLAVLIALVQAFVAPAHRPLAWTAVGLLPPVALGIVFGAGQLPWIAAASLALAAARHGRAILAGVLAGAAIAINPYALLIVLVAPLLLSNSRRGAQTGRFFLASLASLLVVVAPIVLLNPEAFAAVFERTPDLAAGVGVVNIAAYLGIETTLLLHELLALGPWVAAAVALRLLLRAPVTSAAFISVLWLLVALFFARDMPGFALSAPIILLLLGAVSFDGDPREAQ